MKVRCGIRVYVHLFSGFAEELLHVICRFRVTCSNLHNCFRSASSDLISGMLETDLNLLPNVRQGRVKTTCSVDVLHVEAGFATGTHTVGSA